MVEPGRLLSAYETARADLLAERGSYGHWEGRLASSPLSTATAISALVLAEQHGRRVGNDNFITEIYQSDLSEQVIASLYWLARQQNDDGGWGDTDKSLSNIATTMLVRAAFHLTGVPAKYADLLERADRYVEKHGGVAGLLRRYGKDKTFAVPILTNCALADLVPWRAVPALPFELACLPQSFYRFLKLPVVSYAIPALVAVGQARYYHKKPANPIARWIRSRAIQPSLEVLQRVQPESGGFLEATPLTSFVVMSLASIGLAEHRVTRRGIEFLLASVRADGSWPIDTNLATWNTTLAVNALGNAPDGLATSTLGPSASGLLDWVLDCQQREIHPYTGTPPGGWAWTDLSGGVPDADDTPGALLALSTWRRQSDTIDCERIRAAAVAGVRWLLDIQNRDGGWPTFCRGWGYLPFDRSGSDLTAHVIRALLAWRGNLVAANHRDDETPTIRLAKIEESDSSDVRQLDARIDVAVDRGLGYLAASQRADGSWTPLWFGNQFDVNEQNPIYGTAKVLLAYRDFGLLGSEPARRGLAWLAAVQQADGGFGGGPAATEKGFSQQSSCVEETALATEALLAARGESSLQVAAEKGLVWLIAAVEEGRHRESSPIGFYFAKLWYYEALYPIIFTVSALSQAVAELTQQPDEIEPARASFAAPRG